LISAGTLLAAAPAIAAGPTWSVASKTGIGTSYADYSASRAASTVWFSLANGVLTETMFGMIHEIQLKDLLFSVKGQGFDEAETAGTESKTSYLDTDANGRPRSLAYRLVNSAKNGHYEIEKQVFSDPASNSLFLRVTFRSKDGGAITPTLLAHPGLNGTIGGESLDATAAVLHAEKGGTHLVIKSAQPLVHTGAATGELRAELTPLTHEATYDFVIGFGHSRAEAEGAADSTLGRGHDAVLTAYNGGWEHYLSKLSALDSLTPVSEDGGKLLSVSAMVLKASEDKQHPGALIASLSTPWGESVAADKTATGYRAVWPRDFYQCAMALLALGDRETPVAAMNYLKTVQVTAQTPDNKGASGWYLQKTHVDGSPEWIGVQLDQTAMPIMLAWKLSQAGLLDRTALNALYASELKAAATFLAKGGDIAIQFNKAKITPPSTQQERWEEQSGFSPSTTAAVVAGLTVAADIATGAGDKEGAKLYRASADKIAAAIERTMVTTKPVLDGHPTVPHFLRIAPFGKPDAGDRLQVRNGKQPRPEQSYLDAGFLELVRYGVRASNDPTIVASLTQLDDETLPDDLRVKYDFHFAGSAQSFPGWRRYSDDGYGEDTVTGANFGAETADRLSADVDNDKSPNQRGRVWPIFTGERGHYELALASAKPAGASDAEIQRVRDIYVRAMELFANQGLMIPEQVWDGVGVNPGNRYAAGGGTDCATPLSWSHAEYIKLLRSLRDRQVWDRYGPVADRYASAEGTKGGSKKTSR
jgi:glucoamylase